MGESHLRLQEDGCTMARTPEEAITSHIMAIGDRQEIKLAETIHLPFQHYHPNAERVFQWNRPEEVPEYMQMPDPSWAGTDCELDALEPIFASETKNAYKIEVTRFHADGSVMQTFEAIYTVMKKDGDWRVVQRNPINIFPAVRKNSISRDHDGNEAPLH